MSKKPDVGDKAPDFSLPTNGEGKLSLGNLKGKKVVLYFYPRDDTPGCTTEAKDFTSAKKDFDAIGAEIVGISKDTPAKHDKFIAKHDLDITLASDEDGKVLE
jgi:peroxiredoxin Q/BCP